MSVTLICQTNLLFTGNFEKQFCRFSTVAGERGYPDTVRDVRGFAIKFYTEDGIWDIVGNNTPVFFVKDAAVFSSFIHVMKRYCLLVLSFFYNIYIIKLCNTTFKFQTIVEIQ